MSTRLLIQSAIVDFLKDIEFPIVAYDGLGVPSIIDPLTLAEGEIAFIKPLTPILCNEINGVFEEDPQYKRSRILRRSGWTFQIKMRFDREVLLEAFEQSWMQNPLVIPAANGLPQVTLLLQTSEPVHPVQQSGANGTIVTYTFEAELGRG